MKPVYDRWDVFSALKTLLMQSYKNLKMRVGTKCSSHLLWAFFFFCGRIWAVYGSLHFPHRCILGFSPQYLSFLLEFPGPFPRSPKSFSFLLLSCCLIKDGCIWQLFLQNRAWKLLSGNNLSHSRCACGIGKVTTSMPVPGIRSLTGDDFLPTLTSDIICRSLVFFSLHLHSKCGWK